MDEDNLPDQAWDFSFISPRAYILTSCGGSGSIEIFSFVSMPSYRPAHRATLRLPQLQYLSYINHLLTHTAPFMGRPAFPHTSFTTSPDSRIHVLSARYSNPFEHTYTMFVHNRTFLAYASDPRGTQRRDVHWDAWGEHNTRFWNRRISNNWMRCVAVTLFVGWRQTGPPWQLTPSLILFTAQVCLWAEGCLFAP